MMQILERVIALILGLSTLVCLSILGIIGYAIDAATSLYTMIKGTLTSDDPLNDILDELKEIISDIKDNYM